MLTRALARCALLAAAATPGNSFSLRAGDLEDDFVGAGLLSGYHAKLQYKDPLPALKGCEGLDCVKRYVAFQDHGYSWTHEGLNYVWGDYRGVEYRRFWLTLNSQTWLVNQSEQQRWKHGITITVPTNLQQQQEGWAVLAIGDQFMVAEALSCMTGVIGVHVTDVPNLGKDFEGDGTGSEMSEEEEKAHSWAKFANTGQPEWTIELPMSKAAVRAMDAATEFIKLLQIEYKAKNNWKIVEPSRWIVTGGSKRGFTAYHLAAVEPRVKAVIPVSTSMNQDGMLHEVLQNYGGLVDGQIFYDEAGVFALKGETNRRVHDVVDPYAWIDQLTVPKLIMNTGQDSYFYPDCHRVYWDKLPEPKALLMYGPKGHTGYWNNFKFVEAAGAFINSIVLDEPIPKLTWSIDNSTGAITAHQASGHTPTSVRLWSAYTADGKMRDFRKAQWNQSDEELPALGGGSAARAWRASPGSEAERQGRWEAHYIEFEYAMPEPRPPVRISTEVSVWPNSHPFPGVELQDRNNPHIGSARNLDKLVNIISHSDDLGEYGKFDDPRVIKYVEQLM